MEQFAEMIKARAADKDGLRVVPFFACREAARECGLSPREAEIEALKNGVCPSRYMRSIGTLGLEGQAKLLSSRAAVVGCGGLGGWIVEMLARIGVGELVLIDGDVFEDNNLNRQLYCDERDLGMAKAEAAARRVEQINNVVLAMPHVSFIDEHNGPELLAGCNVAIDALDSNKARRAVLSACRGMGIPFVHGAIAGYYAQTCVCYPGDKPLWDRDDAPDKGVETETGNPTFTPPFIAAVEVAETVKILADLDGKLKNTLLWYDLQKHDLQKLKI